MSPLRLAGASMLLALASPAFATVASAERALERKLTPSSRYMPVRGAYDLTGRFMVDLLRFEKVQEVCPPSEAPGDYQLGCVDCSARRIMIVEPGDRRIRHQFREVFEHEAAHCDGYEHP